MSQEESIRAFLAVPLSEEVRAAALAVQRQLREPWGDKVKWVEEDNLHITLKFLGQVGIEKIERLGDVAEDVAGESSPFAVRTGGVGAFPSVKQVRVLWYGVKEGGAELTALASALERSIQQLGFEVEGRFHPHVTLGRVRRESEGLAPAWQATEAQNEGPSMQVKHFVLMQSVLTKGGPTYHVRREFDLKGSN